VILGVRLVRVAVPVLLAAFAILVLFGLWLRWIEPRMLYYPVRHLEDTPLRLGWRFEEVFLTAADGVRIHGWFLPSKGDPAGARAPLTVLFLHGNAGNISNRFEKLAVLRDLGPAVLIVDYRGYGRSEAKPDEAGTYRDARAAYDYLVGRRGLDPRQIVLYGESLGAAVAIELAARLPVAGVVIEEAFTSVPDVAQAMFPFLPARWLVRNRYDSLAKIGRIEAPILVLHSRDDEYFPLRHAQRLAKAARHAEVVELRGGHNEAFLVSGRAYRDSLERFFLEVAGPGAGQP